MKSRIITSRMRDMKKIFAKVGDGKESREIGNRKSEAKKELDFSSSFKK